MPRDLDVTARRFDGVESQDVEGLPARDDGRHTACNGWHQDYPIIERNSSSEIHRVPFLRAATAFEVDEFGSAMTRKDRPLLTEDFTVPPLSLTICSRSPRLFFIAPVKQKDLPVRPPVTRSLTLSPTSARSRMMPWPRP